MKTMFLVCVYAVDESGFYDNNLFKRRIAANLCSIEDWLERYAPIWAGEGAHVQYSDDFCNGEIYAGGKYKYVFETHNIAVLQ